MAGSISLELPMCGRGVHSILIMPIVARCLETIYVCMWRMFFKCCNDYVGVGVNICCVAAVVKDSGLALESRSMLYVCITNIYK